MEKNEQGKVDAPGQNKEYTIFVNGREKMWLEKNINFEQVVILGFGTFENNQSTAYTVTYKKGEDKKSEGSMVLGDIIHVKDKMIFNVSQTNRS